MAGRERDGDTAPALMLHDVCFALLSDLTLSFQEHLQCPRNDSFFFQPLVGQHVWVSVCWNTGGVLCLGKASALEQEIRHEQRQIK